MDPLFELATAPVQPRRPVPLGDRIATGVYEHANGMIKFLAVRGVANKAVKAGFEPDRILEVMIQLYDEHRPITLETVGQRLNRPHRVQSATSTDMTDAELFAATSYKPGENPWG
jgi:hypothetical protein